MMLGTDRGVSLSGRGGVWCNAKRPFGRLVSRVYTPTKRGYHLIARISSVPLCTHDPHSLRNILLIAGLHYSWNVGDLRSFEPTFLFHRGESMRMVNKWLGTSYEKPITTCARYIITLCLAEVCYNTVPMQPLTY